jgi:hemoglobin
MAANEGTLYDRIGGEEGISRLIEVFYERVLADPELGPFFEKTDASKLRAMQKEFFSEALGGPLFYSGRSMREVHAGRGIRKSHLNRFTDHLLAVLQDPGNDFSLSQRDIDAVYSRIALEADEITGGGSEAG